MGGLDSQETPRSGEKRCFQKMELEMLVCWSREKTVTNSGTWMMRGRKSEQENKQTNELNLKDTMQQFSRGLFTCFRYLRLYLPLAVGESHCMPVASASSAKALWRLEDDRTAGTTLLLCFLFSLLFFAVVISVSDFLLLIFLPVCVRERYIK